MGRRSANRAEERGPRRVLPRTREGDAVDETTVLEHLAPYLFVLELDGRGAPAYRLAGRVITGLLGADPTGETFYRHWRAGDRAVLRAWFAASARARRPFRLLSMMEGPEAQPVSLQTVLLPSAADDGGQRFIGVVSADRPLAGARGLLNLRCAAFLADGRNPGAEVWPGIPQVAVLQVAGRA